VNTIRESIITKIILWGLLSACIVYCICTGGFIELAYTESEFDLQAIIASVIFIIICLLIEFLPKYKTQKPYVIATYFWSFMLIVGFIPLMIEDIDWIVIEVVYLIKLLLLDSPLYGITRFLGNHYTAYQIGSFGFSGVFFLINFIILQRNKTKTT